MVLAIPALLVRFDLFSAFCLSIRLSISGAESSTGLPLLSQSITFIVFREKSGSAHGPNCRQRRARSDDRGWRLVQHWTMGVVFSRPVYSSVLQCTPVYSSVLKCTLVYSSLFYCTQCTPVYSSVLQCTLACSSVLSCTPIYSAVLHCTPVYSSVHQCTLV